MQQLGHHKNIGLLMEADANSTPFIYLPHFNQQGAVFKKQQNR
jgi:hypothetical protein